jgi:hypothetical protein
LLHRKTKLLTITSTQAAKSLHTRKFKKISGCSPPKDLKVFGNHRMPLWDLKVFAKKYTAHHGEDLKALAQTSSCIGGGGYVESAGPALLSQGAARSRSFNALSTKH